MDNKANYEIDRNSSQRGELLEDVSDLCNQEWMNWSQNISNNLNKILSILTILSSKLISE